MGHVMNIKVLYLVEDFKLGGLERIVQTLFCGIDRTQYSSSLWCIASGGLLADQLVDKGEALTILNLKSYYNILNIVRLAYMIRKGGFHIVHTSGYFANTMGRIAAFIARTPVILAHVQTTYWGFNKRNILIERVLSNVSDKIICCSEAVKCFVVNHEGIKADKVITLYNGIPDVHNPHLGSYEGINGDSFRMIIIGSLVANKGHYYLLKAIEIIWRHNKQLTLDIVGDGPLKTKLLDCASSLKISGVTNFRGFVDDDTSTKLLSQSHVLVTPSIEREGLPTVILEAMSRSKPVIGSNVGGIPELIEDGITGFIVNPADVDDLASALNNLIYDEELRRRMGEAGRKKYEERFDARIMIREIENLYQSLLIRKGIL